MPSVAPFILSMELLFKVDRTIAARQIDNLDLDQETSFFKKGVSGIERKK